MALTVTNAPQYSGSLSVGVAPAQSINSVGVATGGMQGNTYNPQGNTYNPQQAGGNGGGSVLGATTNYSAPTGPTQAQIAAQQAAQAEAKRLEAFRNSAGIKRDSYISGARTGLRDVENTFRNDTTGLVDEIRQGQNTINSGRAANALNLRRSMAAIAGGVRQGLRSGGVDLANMNALDSGAADALARAWARAGGQQAGGVQNEAELKAQELATQQQNLELQETRELGKLAQWRETEVNRVSNKLYNDLRELEAEAAAEGINDVVQMSIRDQIINEAATQLDAIERTTKGELGKIRGLTDAEVQQKAFQMEQAGTQVANPFAVEAIGQGRQMGGAPIGQFNTTPRYRDEQTPVYNPFRLEEQQVA